MVWIRGVGMICPEKIVDKGHPVTGYDIKEVDSNKVDVVNPNPKTSSREERLCFCCSTNSHDPTEERSYYTFTQIKILELIM